MAPRAALSIALRGSDVAHLRSVSLALYPRGVTMSLRWTLPAAALIALLVPAAARAQDPAPTVEAAPAPAARTARPRAEADPAARTERRAERAARATEAVRRPQPEPATVAVASPETPTANAEQQGGVRRPRSGGGSVSGGGSRGGGSSSGSAGTARPRQGGVRSPASGGGSIDTNGTEVSGGRYVGQAVPRSAALRPAYAWGSPSPYYGRRYYNHGGFGYYYYAPWAWYGGWGWPGYAAYGGWAGYYGSLPYFYGGFGVPVYGAAYGGPYGWSIGGVRIKVDQRDAEVYVDGYFAGVVDDFDGMWQQLRLDDGGHKIEIRKTGMETLTFEVMIQPGRTITYRGTMVTEP
jgi:hypothetical protein